MKSYYKIIFILPLLSQSTGIFAENLINIEKGKIVEVARQILSEKRPSLDLASVKENRITILIDSIPSGSNSEAYIEVDFVVTTTEKLDCEIPTEEQIAQFPSELRGKVREGICTKKHASFYVGFRSENPLITGNVREYNMDLLNGSNKSLNSTPKSGAN